MKRTAKIFLIALAIAFPIRAHASGAVVAAGTAAIIASDWAMQVINIVEYVKSAYNAYETAKNSYEQLQNMIDAERRALENLRSVVDVRSWKDFMNWSNRQLYLARESEYYYDQMGVSIGGETIKMREIDKIPGALRNEFRDPRNDDYTEEQKRDMWISLGLTPGNYTYLKTWEDRNDKIAERILTYSQIYHDEHEEAAARNKEFIDNYKKVNEDLHQNEIFKNIHITSMTQEMLLREQNRLMVELMEYELSRQKMAATPPSPPGRSHIWDENPFGPISNSGHFVRTGEGW